MTEPATPADQYDVIVIGAGPAGCAAAAFLKRAGHEVCVLEKTRFPRFVIGESLLPRCNDLLDEAGLLDAVKRQGYLEKHGALFLKEGECCRFDFAEQHTPGARFTWQVPRDHFDQVLAREVESLGVPVLFEQTVTSARVGDRPQVLVCGAEGEERRIDCRFIIDASGYGRVLPRLLNLDRPSDLPARRALFAHLAGDRRPRGREEGLIWIVQSAASAWSWVIPFSNGRTSFGVVGPAEFFQSLAAAPADLKGRLEEVIQMDAATAARFQGAEIALTPRTIEAYSVGVSQLHGEGFCLVGNATEFLDPVFSSGVTLALESALLAARALDRQLKGESVDWQAQFVAPLKAEIDCFRTYVKAWYAGDLSRLFFSKTALPRYRKMVCSVLAGHAWDLSNPLVKNHERKLRQLIQLV
ncbi:MAG: FAD-dependent oxidoreductase [Planctomycetota bacterium]